MKHLDGEKEVEINKFGWFQLGLYGGSFITLMFFISSLISFIYLFGCFIIMFLIQIGIILPMFFKGKRKMKHLKGEQQ